MEAIAEWANSPVVIGWLEPLTGIIAGTIILAAVTTSLLQRWRG